MEKPHKTSLADKIKFMDIACRLGGYPFKRRDVEQLVLLYESICDLSGDMTLMEVSKIQVQVEEKYTIKK